MKAIVVGMLALAAAVGVYVYRDRDYIQRHGMVHWIATRQGTAYVAGQMGYEAVTPAQVARAAPDCERRLDWARARLGSYGLALGDLKNAANEWNVAPELVAAVALNELADYGWTDEFQDAPPWGLDAFRYGQNFGISQLSNARLRGHNLRRGTDQQLRNCLLDPRCALSVAAGEVHHIVTRLNREQKSDAFAREQNSNAFARELWGTPYPVSVDGRGRTYSYPERQFLQATFAVVTAYNNPDVIGDWDPKRHGDPHYQVTSADTPSGWTHQYGGSLVHANNAVNLFGQCFLEPSWRAALDEGTLTGGCAGSITPSSYRGYHNDPLSFTIRILGPQADAVARVTTFNPLCPNCPAEPAGRGVFRWSNVFAGEGPWEMKFIAYDFDGREICSGTSAPMTSLGDRR